MRLTVSLSEVREVEDGYALGIMTINGVSHHAQFIRVVTDADGNQTTDGKSIDAVGNWERVKDMFGYEYQTTELPGIAGQWVCAVHPFSK